MNAVESRSWLADRTAELEASQGKLAALETQLQQAQEAFGKTNGDPAEFVAARDRVAHLEHQIEQARQSVQTCEENVRVATEGLQRAEKQERIESLTAARAERRKLAATLASQVLDRYEQLSAVLSQLDELQKADPSDVSELHRLDVRVQPLVAANLLWLECMNRAPGLAPAALVPNGSGIRPAVHGVATQQGLVVTIDGLFKMVDYRSDWLPSLRCSLGDTDVVVPRPQPAAPVELPAQPVDARTGYREYIYKARRSPGSPCTEIRYSVEDWALAGRNGGSHERRVVFSSLPPRNAEVESNTVVELVFGIQARLIETKRGEFYLAPARESLVSRAVDAIVDAVSPNP